MVTSLNLATFLKPPSRDSVTLGLEASPYECGKEHSTVHSRVLSPCGCEDSAGSTQGRLAYRSAPNNCRQHWHPGHSTSCPMLCSRILPAVMMSHCVHHLCQLTDILGAQKGNVLTHPLQCKAVGWRPPGLEEP
jgi:hypothetical protein